MNTHHNPPISRDAVDDPEVVAADAHASDTTQLAGRPSVHRTAATAPAPQPTQRAMGQSHIHESARAQVAGAAHYIDDLPEVKGTL